MARIIECRSGRQIKVEKTAVTGRTVASLVTRYDERSSTGTLTVYDSETDSEIAMKFGEQIIPQPQNLSDGKITTAQIASLYLTGCLVTWGLGHKEHCAGKINYTSPSESGLILNFNKIEDYYTPDDGSPQEFKYIDNVNIFISGYAELKDNVIRAQGHMFGQDITYSIHLGE